MENPGQNSNATEELAQSCSKRPRVEVNIADLPVDPGLRIRISDYHPNERDKIQRHYLQREPYQPKDHDFPYIQFGKLSHRFNSVWFKEHATWLEYSPMLELNEVEILLLLKDLETGKSDDINRVVLQNAHENLKLIAPDIQKEIANAGAIETTNIIINGLGDALFSILVDQSRDISMKDQVVIVLCYVDLRGHVIECFLGITHVTDTTALTLKSTIESMLAKHGLSISRLRGQGYDGASNMPGELNGLKTLILLENKFAYYVHCFAHQLQLTLVSVAKNNSEIANFFNLVTNVFNVVGASCKRRDILHEKRIAEVIEALRKNELKMSFLLAVV
ncbi:uncharacterized protein LOC143890992 [Tasmannia lanceolata]|uniref:uncharacterized protein LOC143890992 n=1 Tax=Tasmannia lanceolata TaxID=3420 RepID=UPI004064715F